MKKLFLFIFALSLFISTASKHVYALDRPEEFVIANVEEVIEQGQRFVGDKPKTFQVLKVRTFENPEREIVIDQGRDFTLSKNQISLKNDQVVISQIQTQKGQQWVVVDKYRLTPIILILLFFFLLVLVVTKMRGWGSILGMGISLLVLTVYIVPMILAGHDPVLVSITGSFVILVFTLYLSHGFSIQTSVSVLATIATLALTGLLANIFVGASHLTGLGSEEAYSLQFGLTQVVNFKGLLLGGIIIGALGVLDDVTTSQAAVVYEIWHHNESISGKSLFLSGMKVGKEHIASLVNTLVLAYAGSALPVFLLIIVNPQNQPLWFILNSEMISEEIIRTLTGSIGLVTAVPITTLLASWSVLKFRHPRLLK